MSFVSLVLTSPLLDSAHQFCLTTFEQRGRITFLDLLGDTLPKAAQDTISHLCHKGTLLSHAQLGVHQDGFCKAVFQLVGPQHILVHGVVPHHVQEFAVHLVELHETPVRSPAGLHTTSPSL